MNNWKRSCDETPPQNKEVLIFFEDIFLIGTYVADDIFATIICHVPLKMRSRGHFNIPIQYFDKVLWSELPEKPEVPPRINYND
jgi:hypothetical protein